MVGSVELYDKFAPYFRKYSAKKGKYLIKVDKLILADFPGHAVKILDIGSGDGSRGKAIFDKSKAKYLLMADNSPNMVRLSGRYQSKNIDVREMDISKTIPENLNSSFDVILCLWNVLGHISGENDRLGALMHMKNLLSPEGRIYVDISNRYNLRYYGFWKVFSNIIRDIFSPAILNGDFSYQIPVSKGVRLNSSCHFFNPFEMKKLIRKAGLKVNRKFYIDYENGDIRKTFFEGHILYILSSIKIPQALM